MKKINKFWLLLVVITISMPVLYISRTENIIIEKVVATNSYDADMEDWLDRLKQQESSGVEYIKHLDSNNKFSFGCFQFQTETFVSYTKKYNLLPENEDLEIENWIYDCRYQRKLAKTMIEDNYNNWKHWRTSVGIIGMPPQKND